MSNQIAIPSEITEGEISRKRSFGASLVLCAEAAGYDLDKQLQQDLEVDKAQFSRWKSDKEGIHWQKLRRLMDFCGNHAPVLWMLYDLGYDITTLRKRETELEQQLREEREARIAAEEKLENFKEFAGLGR